MERRAGAPPDARALTRARKRVEAGEAVWIDPFRGWLRDLIARYGWDLVTEWSGLKQRNLRRYVSPDALIVPIDVVDRLLLEEGTTLLEDLYPYVEDGEAVAA